MNKTVVQIIKSGNRFNAWDKDCVKYTSQINVIVNVTAIVSRHTNE